MKPFRLATRRSLLAQTQAQQFADLLEKFSGRKVELVPMSTTGDDNPDRAIESFDAKGLFVDATREAVLSGDCDLVVHSYKDLPTAPFPGLVIGCVPQRVDPRDVLVTREGLRLQNIPRGGRPFHIGTSSTRRKSQLLRTRRDLMIEPLRGNLDTRLRKVAEGPLDAIVVALAGLLRMGPTEYDLKAAPLENGEMLHAPAQGALAVECRSDDIAMRATLAAMDHEDTRTTVTAERAMLATLEGGCTAPIGAHAEVITIDGQKRLELLGMIADPNGTKMVRASHQASYDEPEKLGVALAVSLRRDGQDILDRLSAQRAQKAPTGQG